MASQRGRQSERPYIRSCFPDSIGLPQVCLISLGLIIVLASLPSFANGFRSMRASTLILRVRLCHETWASRALRRAPRHVMAHHVPCLMAEADAANANREPYTTRARHQDATGLTKPVSHAS